MKNETVTLSQELAERLAGMYIPKMHRDAVSALSELRAALDNQHIVCSNGILCQNSKCPECGGNGSYTRAALADPVPPADREECFHDFRMFSSECAKCGEPYAADPVPPAVCATCNGTGIEYDGAGHICTACNGKPVPPADGVLAEAKRAIQYVIGFEFNEGELQTVNADDLLAVYLAGRAQVTRLQAEVERLNIELLGRAGTIGRLVGENNDLKAELTNARELLAMAGSELRHEERFEEAGRIRNFLARQFAPAAKDGE